MEARFEVLAKGGFVSQAAGILTAFLQTDGPQARPRPPPTPPLVAGRARAVTRAVTERRVDAGHVGRRAGLAKGQPALSLP